MKSAIESTAATQATATDATQAAQAAKINVKAKVLVLIEQMRSIGQELRKLAGPEENELFNLFGDSAKSDGYMQPSEFAAFVLWATSGDKAFSRRQELAIRANNVCLSNGAVKKLPFKIDATGSANSKATINVRLPAGVKIEIVN